MENGNKFVVYRSSAGSGKTFTLAKEYLALALPNARFEDILAITFTNKAVNEMKTRILKELSKMKDPATIDMSDGMIKDLSDRLGYDAKTLSEKARRLEFRILHNYSDFAVSTIDSFVQKIIQVFAYDLNIPLGFELILEEEEMREKVVGDVFSSIGIDEEFTDVVLRYVDESMQSDKSWNMERKLVELSKVILAEDAPEKLKQLNELSMKDFMEIRDKLKHENCKVEKRYRDIGHDAMQLFSDNGLDAGDFYQGTKGVYSYFEKLNRGVVKELSSYASKFIDDENCRVNKNSSKQELVLELADKYIIAWLKELKELYSEDYHTRKLLLEKIYTMAVLNAVSEKINEYYRDNNVLHISEQNKKLSDVVLLESIPFVYERLGERYKHFLIDEFQDTSILQWQNLVPLLENSLSSNEGVLSMVVGDAKQAIYRFRQGDVEQFINLPNLSISTDNECVKNIVKQREKVLKNVADIQNLSVNYRTKRDIVNFNNEFFTHLMAVPGVMENPILREIYLGKDYIDNKKEIPDLYQYYPPKRDAETGGYVSVKLVESDKDAILEEVYETIRMLVEEKGYNYGDIAVLGRDKKVLIAVSSYLSDKQVNGKDIPMESAESFLLMKNEEVLFLVSLLKLLHNRADDVSVLNVLEYLDNRKADSDQNNDETLYVNYFIGTDKDGDIFEFLKTIGYELNPTALLSMTLYDCCEALVRTFSLKDRGMEYVISFMNQVAAYSTRNRQDISEFLEELSYKKNSYTLNTTASSDSVKLMTIHKSKGLEFPIVIYPIFLTQGNNGGDMWVDVDKERYLLPISLVSAKAEMSESEFERQYSMEQYKKQLDDINVLYVALTRPEEKLFVVSPLRKPAKDGVCATIESYLTSFVKDGNIYEKGENTCKEFAKEEDKSEKKQEENKPINVLYNTFISEESIISVSPEKTAAIEEGILIHDMFSKIYSAADIDRVIEEFKLKKNLSADYVETLKKRIVDKVTDERYSKYFDPKYSVKTECEILYVKDLKDTNNNVKDTKRPDRVIFADDETWVVDFKTGTPDEYYKEQYKKQIDEYVDIIKAMGYPNVSGDVVYC